MLLVSKGFDRKEPNRTKSRRSRMPIQGRIRRSSCHRPWLTASIIAGIGAVALHGHVVAQSQFASVNDADVTFAEDVAPIVYENCVVCHRPGGIAPMNLITYQDARRYARRIREQVANRLMPPYSYDRNVGIQELQHDWRLPQEDINTVVAWVDAGAPEGDPDATPTPPEFPDEARWTFSEEFGPPDLIVRSEPIDVPAGGNDMWFQPYAELGLSEDRCIKAMQVKPAGEAASVVHHANSYFEEPQPDGTYERTGSVTEYAMGKVGEIVPQGVCRTASATAKIAWDIHLYPGGIGSTAPGEVLEDNVVELGIWLHPADYEAEYEQDLDLYWLNEGELLLPPNSTIMTQGFHSFDHPVRIDSFQPHGHLRLRAASLEVFYPKTGRTEVISMVSNWSAVWHHSHLYEPDAAPLVPAGAVIVVKQWYDNTDQNPNNPDPDQWVSWGQRTADEMTHAWIALTHLDEEGYQRLLAEREAQEQRRVTQQD
jgi:hypothetical protein